MGKYINLSLRLFVVLSFVLLPFIGCSDDVASDSDTGTVPTVDVGNEDSSIDNDVTEDTTHDSADLGTEEISEDLNLDMIGFDIQLDPGTDGGADALTDLAPVEDVTVDLSNFDIPEYIPENHIVYLTAEGFDPETMTITVEDIVDFYVRDDRGPHNVVSDDGTIDSGTLEDLDVWSYTFTIVGEYLFSDLYNEGERFTLTVNELVEAEHDIVITENVFLPDELTISQGETVRWTNLSNRIHTVTELNGTFDSGDLMEGEQFRYTFEEYGEYIYYFTLSGEAIGYLHVMPEVDHVVSMEEDEEGEPILVPDSLEIYQGESVLWLNNLSRAHTVTEYTLDFHSGDIDPGGYWFHEFADWGTYFYYSKSDAGLSGQVTVIPLGDHAIDIGSGGYEPDELVIYSTQTVVWHNDDTRVHAVTATDGSFDSGDMEQGDYFAHTFDEPGVYNYEDSAFVILDVPQNRGTIVVF
jgi:plastocyanin